MTLSEVKDSTESFSKAAEKAESLWGKVEKAAKFIAARHYIPVAVVERVESVGAVFKTANKYLGYTGNVIAGLEVQQWLANQKKYDAAATNAGLDALGKLFTLLAPEIAPALNVAITDIKKTSEVSQAQYAILNDVDSGGAPPSVPVTPLVSAALPASASVITVQTTAALTTLNLGSTFANASLTATESGTDLVLSSSTGGSITIKNWQSGGGLAINVPDGTQWTTNSLQQLFTPAVSNLTFQAGTVYDGSQFVNVVDSLGQAFRLSDSYFGAAFGYGSFTAYVWQSQFQYAPATGNTVEGNPVFSGGWSTGMFTQAYLDGVLSISDPGAALWGDLKYDFWKDPVSGNFDFAITSESNGFGGQLVYTWNSYYGEWDSTRVPSYATGSFYQTPVVVTTPAVTHATLYTGGSGNASGNGSSIVGSFSEALAGATVVFTTNSDGSFQRKTFNLAGTLIADGQANSDGSSSGHTYGVNGALSSSWSDDGRRNTTNRTVDASGTSTEYDVSASGARTVLTVGTDHSSSRAAYRADGTLTAVQIIQANGNQADYVLNTDGSSHTWTNNCQGNTTDSTSDGHGNATNSYANSDGSYGNSTQNTDGSTTSNAYGGGYSVCQTDDGLGNTTVVSLDVQGNTTTVSRFSDGSATTRTDAQGGSFKEITADTTGHVSGRTRAADGSGTDYSNQHNGGAYVNTYGAGGILTLSDVLDPLGMRVVGNYAGGVLTSETTTFDDGTSSGRDFNADGSKLDTWTVDAFGDRTLVTFTGNVVVADFVFNSNGSSSGHTYDAFGIWASSWSKDATGAVSVLASDGYGNAVNLAINSAGSLVSRATVYSNVASGGTLNGTDGSITTWTNNGSGRLTKHTVYADGSTKDSTISADTAGTQTEHDVFSNGTTQDSVRAVDGSGTSLAHNADGFLTADITTLATGASSGHTYGPLGTVTTWTDDGLNNTTSTIADGLGNSSEHDTFADGSTRDSLTNADGSSSTQSHTSAGALTADSLTRPDGSSSGHAYGTNGRVTTWANDGHGDVVTTTPDGSGNVTQHSVFANGTVADSISHADGSGSSQTHAANGALTANSLTFADGSTSGHDYAPNGTVTTWTNNGHGVTTSVAADGHGNATERDVYADGTTRDSTTKADGSYSQQTHNSTGVLQTSTYTNADGSHGSFNLNADGSSQAFSTSANGSQRSTQIGVDGTEFIYNFDAHGNLTGYSYAYVNGSHGDYIKNADGSTLAHQFNADGSHSTSIGTSNGSSTQQGYTGAGVLQNSSYWNIDGSHGSYNLNTDGSSWASSTAADGAQSSTQIGADGSKFVYQYDAQGVLTGDTFAYANGLHGDYARSADGSSVSHQYNVDGSYSLSTTASDGSRASVNHNADGSSTSQAYSAGGALLSDSMTSATGASSGHTYGSAGSGTTWTNDGLGHTTSIISDGQGNTIEHDVLANGSTKDTIALSNRAGSSQTHDAAGILIADSVFNADGSSSGNTYATGGSVVSSWARDIWGGNTEHDVLADGSTKDSSSNWFSGTITQTHSAAGALIADSILSRNGTSSGHTYGADGATIAWTNDGLGNTSSITSDGQGHSTELDSYVSGVNKSIVTSPDGAGGSAKTYSLSLNKTDGAQSLTLSASDTVSVAFDSTVIASDVTFTRRPNGDLFLGVSGGASSLTIPGYFNGSAGVITAIQFSGGAARLDLGVLANLPLNVGANDGVLMLASIPASGLAFTAGVTASQITATRDLLGNLTLLVQGGTTCLTFPAAAAGPLSTLSFVDGSHLSTQDLYGQSSLGMTNATSSLAETVNFDLGSGAAVLAQGKQAGAAQNSLVFGTGISSADVHLTQQGSDLLVKVGTSGDQITVPGYFTNGTASQFSSITFADGTQWSATTASEAGISFEQGDGAQVAMLSSASSNTVTVDSALSAASVKVSIDPAGNLRLSSSGSTDSLTLLNWANTAAAQGSSVNFSDGTAWTYADIVRQLSLATTDVSSPNEQTVVFSVGDGVRTVTQNKPWGAEQNVLAFGPGITPTDVTFFDVGHDLVVRLRSGDQLTIPGYFSSWTTASHFSSLQFSNGTSIAGSDMPAVVDASNPAWSPWGNPYVDLGSQSGSNPTTVLANVPNTYIWGGQGDITVDSTADYVNLSAGAGTNTFNLGASQYGNSFSDWRGNNGEHNFVQFGSPVLASDITYSLQAWGGLVMTDAQTGGSLTLQNFLQGGFPLDAVRFSDGTTQTLSDIKALFANTPGADGTLQLGAGQSYWGADTSGVITAGDGWGIVLKGSTAGDTLIGGTGSDALYATSGDNLLELGSGGGYLYGGTGTDLLIGYKDAYAYVQGKQGVSQLLFGGASGDNLGGQGVLIAGADQTWVSVNGKSVLAFNQGDGNQSVYGLGQWSMQSDNSTISVGGGVQDSDISLSRDGQNLVLHLGTTDSIELSNWYPWSPSYPGQAPHINLQVLEAASADFDATSADPLKSRGVQEFDLNGFAAAFDAAQSADSSVTSMHLSDAIAQFLVSTSDGAAYGGDVAYYYGTQGTLGGLSTDAARAVLKDPAFGQMQSVHDISAMRSGTQLLPGLHS